MSDGLAIRKRYIDSRHRSSGTTDDFEIQLEEGIQLPASAHCYLSEFTGVVSWKTLNDSSRNLFLGKNVGGASSYRVVQPPLGAHASESPRAVLQDALNSGRAAQR